MKLAIAALLAGSAAAFAPAGSKARVTSLDMSFENELGVISPTGFFDPLGLSKSLDQVGFDKYRAAELKHGRVAMLAVVGYVTPEIFTWPGNVSPGLAFADVPHGIAAVQTIPALGLAQIFLLIGYVDYTGNLGDFDGGKPIFDASILEQRKLQELQHGRLAMLAIAELVRHDLSDDGLDHLITGLPFLY